MAKRDQKREDYVVQEVRSGRSCKNIGDELGVSGERIRYIFTGKK